MEEKERFKSLNKYLKRKFGEKTLKICIDGGFTCPNRDGTLSNFGCIFCSNGGSGEHIKEFIEKTSGNTLNKSVSLDIQLQNITNQVTNYLNSYKAKRANIAYFQNFSNTYDSIENLKKKYDSALISEKIVALAIATRPDCINEDICSLLSSYMKHFYVYVELGLQTSNNFTGNFINRCYTSEQFTSAVKLLNKYNINVVTHIMIGLPNESFKDLEDTVSFINNHNIKGIKIHSTYVVKNTMLEKLYNSGKYIPISLESYIEYCAYVITHINPNVIIHKISGDAPKDLLVAPQWNKHKKWIINGITKYLNENNLYQGQYYKSL